MSRSGGRGSEPAGFPGTAAGEAERLVGWLRILAIASPRRIARLPDVPTTAEAGYPNVVIAPWYGLLAPMNTPPDVIKRLVDAYEAAVRSPTMRSRIEALGYEPLHDSPGQLAGVLREEIASFRSIVADAATTAPR